MRGNYSAVLKVIKWQQKQVFLVLLLFNKQGRREGGLFKGGTFSTLSYMNIYYIYIKLYEFYYIVKWASPSFRNIIHAYKIIWNIEESLSTCTWTATSCCLFISLMWWATPVMADRASCGSKAQKDQSQYWEELFKAWIALVQLSHWYNSNFSHAIKRIYVAPKKKNY